MTMGYQGGRRDGGDDRARSDWDRGSDRYRGQRDLRDDRSYRYGTRGQFSGPDPRRQSEQYDPEERGFFDRAGDEIRSWFGDEEAERRREYDEYYNRPYGDPRDESSRMGFASASRSSQYLPNRGYAPYTGERSGYGSEDHGSRVRSYGPTHDYGEHHDASYFAWRRQRVEELDRDYAEYQRENRDRFNSEFGTWRTRRTEQRQAVQQVREHMEVVGSDGEHVGTVDRLSGDRIILTKTDQDASGVHHSVPSSWIRSVDEQRVTLEKTADDAHRAWRTEREQNALFNEGRESSGQNSGSMSSPRDPQRYR
jgi:hypothetical protein